MAGVIDVATLSARSVAQHLRDHCDEPETAGIIDGLCDEIERLGVKKARIEALVAGRNEAFEDLEAMRGHFLHLQRTGETTDAAIDLVAKISAAGFALKFPQVNLDDLVEELAVASSGSETGEK